MSPNASEKKIQMQENQHKIFISNGIWKMKPNLVKYGCSALSGLGERDTQSDSFSECPLWILQKCRFTGQNRLSPLTSLIFNLLI